MEVVSDEPTKQSPSAYLISLGWRKSGKSTSLARVSSPRNGRLWGWHRSVVEGLPRGIRIRASAKGKHHVAQRRAAGGVRPIIDVVNRSLLAPLLRWEEVKVAAFNGLIDVTPSVRAFTIRRQRSSRAPWRTLEVFSGGGRSLPLSARIPTFVLWRCRDRASLRGCLAGCASRCVAHPSRRATDSSERISCSRDPRGRDPVHEPLAPWTR